MLGDRPLLNQVMSFPFLEVCNQVAELLLQKRGLSCMED